nr:NADH dehydrogenase subunit 4L [Laemonema barbatulum]
MTPTHYVITMSFILSFLGFAFHRTHLISALLCLETMMLSLFVMMTLWTLQQGATSQITPPLLMLTFSACEASAGLALLVATARTHGSDHLHNLSLLQC